MMEITSDQESFFWVELSPFPQAIVRSSGLVIRFNAEAKALINEWILHNFEIHWSDTIIPSKSFFEFLDSEEYLLPGPFEVHPPQGNGKGLLSETPRSFEVFTRFYQDSTYSQVAVVTLLEVTQIRVLEQVRRDFIANVSHELKTPMTLIRGSVETLVENPEVVFDKTLDLMGVLDRHVQRLHVLVDDLLILSQLERDRVTGEIERSPCFVRVLLEQAAELAQDGWSRWRSVDLTLDCPEDLIWGLGRNLFVQAVTNLVHNAIAHSGENGKIVVRSQSTPEGLRIEVQDFGCGIPLEHHERLFERFYRVDPSRARSLGGSGLGLSIVKHVALAHGGNVGVNSSVNRGSVFWMTLPPYSFH